MICKVHVVFFGTMSLCKPASAWVVDGDTGHTVGLQTRLGLHPIHQYSVFNWHSLDHCFALQFEQKRAKQYMLGKTVRQNMFRQQQHPVEGSIGT